MDEDDALNGQEASPENKPTVEADTQVQTSESRPSMDSLLKEEGLSLDFPQQGETRTGVIASIGENEVLVSIGTKSEGIIPLRELDQLNADEREKFAIGREIPVYVVVPEDSNGNVQLSYTRALEEQDWQRAETLLESGENFAGKIIGFNKGGLLVPLGHLRGFVPGSQVSILRRADATGSTPEQRWGDMVDETITTRVIEVDRERRRLILSERAALQETRESLKERLLEELKEGDIRTGRVTSLANFGAFVNIDGADGLVHLSELSWERIDHPREVLKVGQEVQVKVIGVDQERKRIGLSIRQLLPDPWLKQIEDIKEGQLVEGTITHLTKFGAFAKIGEDLEGLIHISELSDQRIAHPKEIVHEGDVVTLRVIKIEPERHRIGLSVRKVDSPAYADLDWKTTLAEIVEETQEGPEGKVEEASEQVVQAQVEGPSVEKVVTTEETERQETEGEQEPEPPLEDLESKEHPSETAEIPEPESEGVEVEEPAPPMAEKEEPSAEEIETEESKMEAGEEESDSQISETEEPAPPMAEKEEPSAEEIETEESKMEAGEEESDSQISETEEPAPPMAEKEEPSAEESEIEESKMEVGEEEPDSQISETEEPAPQLVEVEEDSTKEPDAQESGPEVVAAESASKTPEAEETEVEDPDVEEVSTGATDLEGMQKNP